MAIADDSKGCRGCGARRGATHCKYPSNPTVDASVDPKNKRAPLLMDREQVRRRNNANAIRKANSLHGL